MNFINNHKLYNLQVNTEKITYNRLGQWAITVNNAVNNSAGDNEASFKQQINTWVTSDHSSSAVNHANPVTFH